MAVIACVLVIRPLLRGGVPGTYVPCSKEACRAISTTEWNKRESQLEDFFCDIREHYEMSLKKKKERQKQTHSGDEGIFYFTQPDSAEPEHN